MCPPSAQARATACSPAASGWKGREPCVLGLDVLNRNLGSCSAAACCLRCRGVAPRPRPCFAGASLDHGAGAVRQPRQRAELQRTLEQNAPVLEAQAAVVKTVAKLIGPAVVHIEADVPPQQLAVRSRPARRGSRLRRDHPVEGQLLRAHQPARLPRRRSRTASASTWPTAGGFTRSACWRTKRPTWPCWPSRRPT